MTQTNIDNSNPFLVNEGWLERQKKYLSEKYKMITQMKIDHIILDYSNHFLVVNGSRGPLCSNNSFPATHPIGFIRYRSDAYNISKELKGKIFCISNWDVKEIKDDVCEPAQEKWKEWVEVTKTCIEIKLARYPEYKKEPIPLTNKQIHQSINRDPFIPVDYDLKENEEGIHKYPD